LELQIFLQKGREEIEVANDWDVIYPKTTIQGTVRFGA
jgi:hypothetical protein